MTTTVMSIIFTSFSVAKEDLKKEIALNLSLHWVHCNIAGLVI